MSASDVTIDDRGWAQAQIRPSWRPDEEGRTRRGLPWTTAEDRALLRGVAKASTINWDDPTIRTVARAHGRTSTAIATRANALRSGIRLAMTAKQATPPRKAAHVTEATPSIRPLHDRILVKRVEAENKTPGGLIIPDNAKEKPVEGLVVAVGSGIRTKEGELIPLDVKAGDRVLFSKYSGTEVKVVLDGGEHLILREDDVLAVFE
jgi:chaperonin GroES